MSTTAPPPTSSTPVVRDAMVVLASARDARARSRAAEVQVLVDAVDWAVANPPVLERDAAVTYVTERTGERPVREPLNADGVPEVDRAAVAEYGLALGCSTQAAQALIGDALELAYRLPCVWARTVAGEVEAWRARQVAQATRVLPRLGAEFVDRQVAPTAHRLTGSQLERTVGLAMGAFDPQAAREAAERAREHRCFELDIENTSLSGLTDVAGRIDLPDALDLDAAIGHAAHQLAAWGSTESLDVRRARALGDLARQHLSWAGEPIPTWTAEQAWEGPGTARGVGRPTAGGAVSAAAVADEHDDAAAGATGPAWRVPPKRQVVLYLHLTDTAFAELLRRGHSAGAEARTPMGIGRVENTGTPITAETVREWCGDPRTSISVRPVLDLAETLHAESYEIPARLREQIRLRDGTCVFPACHAKGLYCQDDHCEPYDHDHPTGGGQTETTNLALLCQRHHTLKTHHGFTYTMLASGAVLWRTPHGLRIRRNRDGTTEVEGLPETGPSPVASGHGDPRVTARADAEHPRGHVTEWLFGLSDPGDAARPPEP